MVLSYINFKLLSLAVVIQVILLCASSFLIVSITGYTFLIKTTFSYSRSKKEKNALCKIVIGVARFIGAPFL